MYEPTTLGYAILGLLLQPMTGYGLRKVFETTPMGEYSSSPGTIYPALKRLEQEKLIEKYTDYKKSASGKKQYRLTKSGRIKLKNWCSKPADSTEVQKKMDELMLRFVFMESMVDTETVINFLESVKQNINSYIKQLDKYYRASRPSMPFHGILAMEQGIEMIRTNSRWVKHAIQTITEHKKR